MHRDAVEQVLGWNLEPQRSEPKLFRETPTSDLQLITCICKRYVATGCPPCRWGGGVERARTEVSHDRGERDHSPAAEDASPVII